MGTTIWRAALFYAALATGLFRRVLFDPAYFIPWDFTNFHLPLAAFQTASLRAGEFPFWEPFMYCGRPLAANPQAATFYPPRWITLLASLHSDTRQLLDLLEVEAVAHVALAGLLAYILARRVALAPIPALTAGTAYSCGCYFVSQAEHLGAVTAAAWLPLIAIGAVSASWRLFGLGLGLSILAGFTPAVIPALVAAWIVCGKTNWSTAAKGTALGLALAAIQIIPAAQLTLLSIARYRSDWRGTGGGVPLVALRSFIDPWFSSNQHEVTLLYLFSGWLGLAFAIWGFRRHWRYALWLIAAVAAMLGDATPLGAWLFVALPGFLQGPYYPAHFMAVMSLGLAVATGVGVAKLPLRWQPFACALVAGELLLAGSGRLFNAQTAATAPFADGDSVGGETFLLSDLRRLAGDRWRVEFIDDEMQWVTAAPINRLATTSGYDPMALSSVMDARRPMTGGERWGAYYPLRSVDVPTLNRLGVRYIVSTRPLALPQLDSIKALWPVRRVYENVTAQSIFGTARILARSPGRVQLKATGELQTSVPYYPGWQATVDGKPARLREGDFLAIDAGSGEHTIELSFRPWIFAWAALPTALALAALLGRRRFHLKSRPPPRGI